MSSRVERFRVTSLSVALVMLFAVLPPGPAAQAAATDAGIAELHALLGQLAPWSAGLAEVGKLAEAVPTVGRSAGSLLGFPDLVQKAVVDELAGIEHWTDLNGTKELPIDLGDGRAGTLTTTLSSSGSTKTLDVAVDVARTLADEPFSFASDTPRLSLSSAGGLTVTASATLDFSVVVEQTAPATFKPYLAAGPATPSLSVDVGVDLPSSGGLSASIGILGVTATETATQTPADGPDEHDATLHLTGAVNDPDGDGRLYFTRPDGTAGELADPSSLEGLVQVGFRPAAQGGAGALDMELTLTASGDSEFSIPSVNATVVIDWADISTGSPTVTTTGLGSVQDFLRMTPRDLADLLGQLVTVVTAAQRSPGGNLDLPFLSGTLADAVKGAEALVAFLSENVVQPPDPGDVIDVVDPARVGEPEFVSIQDLVERLRAFDGGPDLDDVSIGVTVGDYANQRLPLNLTIRREASAALDLVEPDVAASGTGDYGAKTLTDATKEFGAAAVGRRVVAGTAGGIVESVSGSTLTLKEPWAGGQPANGTPYSLSGPEVDAGAVTLANLLTSDGKGIRNANAVTPTATVTPDYTAQLRFALDLQAPRTDSACLGPDAAGKTGAAVSCPYERANPDGTRTVITEEPLPVERLLIGTGYNLLEADFPIEAGIDVFAKAGFLGVRLGGAVKICSTGATASCANPTAGDPMLSIALKSKPGDPTDGYVPITQFFPSLISNPLERLGFTPKVRGYASGNVSVPDAAQFLPGGASAGFTATWANIGVGSPDVQVDDLSEILAFDIDPDNPMALLGVVLRSLQLLDDQMRAGGGTGILGQEIPLVGRSLGDFLGADESGGGPTVEYATTGSGDNARTTLKDTSRTGDRAFPSELEGRSVVVGTQVAVVRERVSGTQLALTPLASEPAVGTPYSLRSELADAISLLTASPPDSLQDLIKVLDERLGGDHVRFNYRDVGGAGHLVVDTEWQRAYATEAPVELDLDAGTLAGATGRGTAKVKVSADIDVDLAVPLTADLDAVTLKVLDTSHVGIDAQGSITGDVIGSLGPLSVSLGKPGDPIDAKAAFRYSLGFTGAGTGTASTLSGFLSAVTPTVNAYSGEVDCGETDTGDDLALCANLPLYVSTNGTTWSPFTDGITLRLPKNPDSNLFDLNAHGGKVSASDSRDRVEAPSAADIAAAVQSMLLDFGMLGDGIDAFLAVLERSLNEAALNGKLPLAGEDLQAGADFIGDLRRELTSLFNEIRAQNGGRLPDAAKIEEFLDDKFNDALESAGANPDNFDLDITCKLQPANVTSVTAHGTPPETEDPPKPAFTDTHRYKIIAVGTFNNGDVDTRPGTVRSVSARPPVPTTSHYNMVSWSKPAGAKKFKVLRQINNGSWQLLATVTSTSYKDDGSATPSAAPAEQTQLATIDDCPSVPAQDIQGVVLRVDLGTGSISGDKGCEDVSGKPCMVETIPLDIGVPGLALRAKKEGGGGGIRAQVGWRAHLAFELDRANGFSVLTKDQGKPEFGVGLNLDLSGPLQAELAFLKIDVTKQGTLPAFAAAFQVDLKSAASETSCFSGTCPADPGKRLTLAKLNSAQGVSDVLAAQLNLNLNLDWLLDASADPALPGVEARLVMTWSKLIGGPQGTVSPKAEDGTGLTIAFNDVAIDAGKFLTGVLGPVVREIKKVTGPVQPVIDTLYAPIPVLSDLSRLAGGGDVTIVTLAKTFSTLADGPDLDFVDTVAAVITFANNLPDPDGTDMRIPIGSFTVSGTGAFSTAATPDAGAGLISGRSFIKEDGSTTSDPGQVDLAKQIDDRSTDRALTDGTTDAAGFTFPLLENPGLIFNLIMNKDVDLVTFDSGPLTLAFTWRQSFGPVYAPPPVFITLSGTASVTARIQAGFDTYGLRKLAEEGASTSTVVGILNGLYFKSTDDAGKPLPVVTFYGEIAAGAAVSAVIITVGVEGGVSLTVSFAWNDPNNDGKFRLFEFGQVALNNPICLFQVAGRIGVFLRVYITLGVSPFSVSFSFTLADVTLLDFSAKPDCDPPPPRLGGVADSDGNGTNDTLVVFAGDFGGIGTRGHKAWSNTEPGYEDDVVKVVQLYDFAEDGTATTRGVKVEALGISETWSGPDFAGITRVVVDGGDYDRNLKVTMIGEGDQSQTSPDPDVVPTGGFTLDAVVIGGSGEDTIKVGTGRSMIDGGRGADTITASDEPAPGRVTWIAGGGENDTISSGDADAIVAGDSHLRGSAASYATRSLTVRLADTTDTKVLTGVVDWTKLVAPGGGEAGTDGADRVAVGLGRNTTYGNGGDDSVSVAADSELAKTRPAEAARWTAQPNTIVLGTGSDTAKGGSNDDTIWTATHTSATRADGDVDSAGSTDTGAVRNIIDTGEGDDTVFGGTAPDHVTSSSKPGQAAHLRGGGGKDVLLGGLGADELFGGPGQDWVVAEPAAIGDETGTDAFGVVRTYAKNPLPAGTIPSPKLLVGGDHADRIIGGDGGARIFGDRFESVACGSVAASGEPQSTAPAEPAGVQPGRDLILGGAGVDKVKGGGEADRIEGFAGDDLLCGQDGNDLIFAGDGEDTVWGGSGNDTAYGDAGADKVYGNDGNDHLYGGAGNDVIEGNDGSDTGFGGDGADVILGGTRAKGLSDQGDVLYGGDGNDVIIGDNGTNTKPLDLDAANLDAGGPDRIYGGDGDDRAFGGLHDDELHGGSGNDHLQGNHGGDTIFGDGGEDQIIGGGDQEASTGVGYPDGSDTIDGGAGNDLITGDNALLFLSVSNPTPLIAGRGFALPHAITLLDLGESPDPLNFAGDLVMGGSDNDVILGQGGPDRLKGNGGDDLIEGGPGSDWIEGNTGDDDLVGGSSVSLSGTGDATAGQPDTDDALWGGPGDDVMAGDNAVILRGQSTRTKATDRLGMSAPGQRMTGRLVTLLDRRAAPGAPFTDGVPAHRYGDDRISGGDGVDVAWGQDGDDYLSGGAHDDYLEGNGGDDELRGDLPLITALPHFEGSNPTLPDPGWPGLPSSVAELEGANAVAGQDDMIGGSAWPGFRDGDDRMQGDGESDVMLGDNGSLMRTLDGTGSSITERVYVERYPTGAVPANATKMRSRDPDLPGPSTRFCAAALPQCEPAGAFGADLMYGGTGDDGMWGQDGDDEMHGGDGDDDMFGELGDDIMFGDDGEDVLLGDRGGVFNSLMNDSSGQVTATLSSVPQESYTGRRPGSYDRRVDLLHDTDGNVWVGGPSDAAMAHPGLLKGGDDLIRGGKGNDQIHAGWGDDIANGDSGGDALFGGDGADVLWGGKGCEPADGECPLIGGAPDLSFRGTADQGGVDGYVDIIFGGRGGSHAVSVEGADILDWAPRLEAPCAPGARWPVDNADGTTSDPCIWLEMTDLDDTDTATNQHHHGTDWIYGGWDRDVMQGDVAANGPNPGDRLLDWNGAYNFWSHCNAAYGGFNDVRQHSPAMVDFLQKVGFGSGAGRTLGDTTSSGTSAFREISISYAQDTKQHAAGPAFPGTPGHFDKPVACAP